MTANYRLRTAFTALLPPPAENPLPYFTNALILVSNQKLSKMKGTRNVALLVVLGLFLMLGVWGCNGYNGVIKQDESVKKAWNNVNTEYQKRGDLVDNLVNTVKGAANFEKETLTGLVEARAKAT